MEIPLSSGTFFRVMNALNPYAVRGCKAKVSANLRTSCCEFQREYTNYWFTCSRLHRDFKDAFKNNSANVDDCYESLREVVEDGLLTLCGDQAQGIRDYFSASHSWISPPRVGIHVMTESGEIANLIMLPYSGSETATKQVADYTLFDKVVSKGLPYLDNNLPRTAKSVRGYKHAGLGLDTISSNYKPPFFDKKLLSRWRGNIFRSTSDDHGWDTCWKDGDQNLSHYKSHLAVPITFKAHADRNRLNHRLVEILELPEGGRSILGFLLVDHPATYYFDDPPAETFENVDVNIMYLFADTLSFVFITWMNFLIKSTSAKEYLSLRGEPEG